MGRLDNKVVIITGAARGIGKETAKTFLEESAKVALVDLDKDTLKEIKDELDSLGEILASLLMFQKKNRSKIM